MGKAWTRAVEKAEEVARLSNKPLDYRDVFYYFRQMVEP